jgi:ferritin-like metal-binding protein YciE
MPRDAKDQLVKYLTDAHSIEEQALAQLRSAPDLAGTPELAAVFAEHLRETEDQERAVRERLEQLGATPCRVKDVVMAAGGKGFVLFARLQPDTPGKLAAHAYSYEHLELAGYALLRRVAERAGDEVTVALAERIGEQERAMAERLAARFDDTVEASLRGVASTDLRSRLRDYLADAHAIERQAIGLLERAPKITGDPVLAGIFREHLAESKHHLDWIERRMHQLAASPSLVKDAAMRLGALNWTGFFQAHPDTPGKLTAFGFAFEHLEIGAYEQLCRVAVRVGDGDTEAVVKQILDQERTAAEKVSEQFDHAADVSLEGRGIAVA